MTGTTLAISIATARYPRGGLPDVCLTSSFTDTNSLSHFRHLPILSQNPSQTLSILAVRSHPKSSNPHSKRSSISGIAPFK